ncbi:hypothetical protein DIPPA_05846 [Diplonema papillatum]|nr:hypothetical protein DIPPA_05846 [Diplonema papillatum]
MEYFVIGGNINAVLKLKAQLMIGLNSSGIREGLRLGEPLLFLDGLYVSDTDSIEGNGGEDVKEIDFYGELGAEAGVNLLFVSAKVGGSVSLTFGMDLNDPDGDGQLQFREVKQAAVDGSFFDLIDITGGFCAAVYAEVKLCFFCSPIRVGTKGCAGGGGGDDDDGGGDGGDNGGDNGSGGSANPQPGDPAVAGLSCSVSDFPWVNVPDARPLTCPLSPIEGAEPQSGTPQQPPADNRIPQRVLIAHVSGAVATERVRVIQYTDDNPIDKGSFLLPNDALFDFSGRTEATTVSAKDLLTETHFKGSPEIDTLVLDYSTYDRPFSGRFTDVGFEAPSGQVFSIEDFENIELRLPATPERNPMLVVGSLPAGVTLAVQAPEKASIADPGGKIASVTGTIPDLAPEVSTVSSAVALPFLGGVWKEEGAADGTLLRLEKKFSGGAAEVEYKVTATSTGSLRGLLVVKGYEIKWDSQTDSQTATLDGNRLTFGDGTKWKRAQTKNVEGQYTVTKGWWGASCNVRYAEDQESKNFIRAEIECFDGVDNAEYSGVVQGGTLVTIAGYRDGGDVVLEAQGDGSMRSANGVHEWKKATSATFRQGDGGWTVDGGGEDTPATVAVEETTSAPVVTLVTLLLSNPATEYIGTLFADDKVRITHIDGEADTSEVTAVMESTGQAGDKSLAWYINLTRSSGEQILSLYYSQPVSLTVSSPPVSPLPLFATREQFKEMANLRDRVLEVTGIQASGDELCGYVLEMEAERKQAEENSCLVMVTRVKFTAYGSCGIETPISVELTLNIIFSLTVLSTCELPAFTATEPVPTLPDSVGVVFDSVLGETELLLPKTKQLVWESTNHLADACASRSWTAEVEDTNVCEKFAAHEELAVLPHQLQLPQQQFQHQQQLPHQHHQAPNHPQQFQHQQQLPHQLYQAHNGTMFRWASLQQATKATPPETTMQRGSIQEDLG